MWITSGKNVDRQKLKKHRVFEGDPQKSCIFSRKMQKKKCGSHLGKMWIAKKLKKHRVFEGDPQKSCIFSRKMQKKKCGSHLGKMQDFWGSEKVVPRNVDHKMWIRFFIQKKCGSKNADTKKCRSENAGAELCICNLSKKCRSE